MKIGFIGAGRMGRPIVDRLMAAGHDVTVLARTPEARAALDSAGVTCADSVAATVRDAEAVFSVVLNDEQVRTVCLGPTGAVAAMQPGAVLVQHTTSDPDTVALIAEQGAGRIEVLDAALSGGPHDIAVGRLTLWVAGTESVFESARALLKTYADPVMYVGPDLGNGQRVKLVNNALLIAHVGLAVDALRLAGSLGIGEREILAAVQLGSGASRGLSIVAGMGSVDAVGERLSDLMAKDVAVVRDVAQRAGVDLGVIGDVLSSDAVEHHVLRKTT